MKKILTAFLPALSLLTLGSCASTSQLVSTEDDGVYYSSKDRTTRNVTASSGQSGSQAAQGADGQTGTDEAANPEYRSGSSNSGSGSSSEYYDEDYGYAAKIRRFHQPVYRGFGYGYYDLVYVDPFGYGGGYSPYGWGPGYYGAYYDPFYSPYAYGGSYISINIGFGRPYYNPWRYGSGYGYGGYGGYGYGGYGGYYDGYRSGYYNGLSSAGGRYGGPKTHYGPRRDGAHEAMSSTAGAANGGRGRGRIDEGGVSNPTGGRSGTGGFSSGGNGSGTPAVLPGRGRGRIVEGSNGGVTPSDAPIRQPMTGQNNNGRDLTDQQIKDRESRAGQLSGATDQPRLDTGSGRGRWRAVDNGNPSGTDVSPATPQDYSQPRRGRYREVQQSPQSGDGTDQPQQRPSRQRVFGGNANQSSQPSQPSEQPTRQRSNSEPTRTYSAPTNNGSGTNGGGGNSGGGGSRGRGRMQ